jgi:hypothetical protein
MVRTPANNWSETKWNTRDNRTGRAVPKNKGISTGRKANPTTSKKLRDNYKCITGKFGVFCNVSKGANTKNYNKYGDRPKVKTTAPKKAPVKKAPKKAPVKKAPVKKAPVKKATKKAPVKKMEIPENIKGMNRQQYLDFVKVVLVKDLTKEQKKIYNKLEKAPRISSAFGLSTLKRRFKEAKFGGKDFKKVENKPVKKAPVKKAPVKKAPVKKAPVKKEAPKKAPVKKQEIELTKDDIDDAVRVGWNTGDMAGIIILQNDRPTYDKMAKFIEKQVEKNKPIYVNLISSLTKRYNDMIIEKKGAKKWLEGLQDIVEYVSAGEGEILNPLLKGEMDRIPKGAVKQRNIQKVYEELGLKKSYKELTK